MKPAFVSAFAALVLLALAASASHASDCENVDYSSIDGFHFGNGAGEVVDYGQFGNYWNATAGEWMPYVLDLEDVQEYLADVSVVYHAIEGTNFFTKDWYTNHADLDGDGDVDGLPGPHGPSEEDFLTNLPDPMTGDVLSIPIARNELCMWSESMAGPTGVGFVCADQDDGEFQIVYVTECDEDGKIVEIHYETIDAKNVAADQLAEDILGDNFLHRDGPASVWYMTVRGEH